MMEHRNIVVVGASAGGFEAIRQLVAGFPTDLNATILIVWHMAAGVSGILPKVLNKESGLFAAHGIDNESLQPGRIYVAPPDRHMLVERGRIRITKGPKENRFRPAIDPLFRSAALAYGPRTIGIILSGALDDGSAGLWAIKSFGGITIVQDPDEAEVRAMPENALNSVQVDYKLKVAEIGAVIRKLSDELVSERDLVSQTTSLLLSQEVEVAMGKTSPGLKLFQQGKLSQLTCPDCHGTLASFIEGDRMRYRCHTGHAFSANVLLDGISTEIEEYLWNAARASQEATMLLNSLGDHFAEFNNPRMAAMYFNKARDTERRLAAIFTALHFHEAMPADVAAENARAQK